MLLKGNNAEKIAISIIIFFVLFASFILISIAFKSMTHSSVEDMVKDGMGFAATGLAPIIAILLFNDWRENHRLVRDELEVNDLYKKIRNDNLTMLKFVYDLAHQKNKENTEIMENYFEEYNILNENNIYALNELERMKPRLINSQFYNVARKILNLQFELIFKIFRYLEFNKTASIDQSEENIGASYKAWLEFNNFRVEYELESLKIINSLKIEAEKYII
ncbi:hypothetical protein EA716_18905 [Acinetobacter baumannii]|uniref:hypothetical protein n=1 Tax=Acinetobacter baumannii TaxID=470 RepID=UPI000F746B91|nr:hypothetical protein [Acinetobacter baumannii]RSP90809.1 hypothetical protein EA716_18905 [Acinetobacter baumannii]